MTTDFVYETPEKQWTLTAFDRCDVCGVQAYVQVFGVSGDLMFCAHDYGKIIMDDVRNSALQTFAFQIVDERERLIDNR